MMPLPRLIFTTAAGLGCAASALAVDDAAALDARPMLEALRTIKTQQETSVKATKQRFIQEAAAAASNPARAAELWEEAIRATQFQGVPKENLAFKEWKEKDGEALKDGEVKVALHLYFNWLALTLQRTAGAEVKTLFPAVLAHAREVAADQVNMEAFEEAAKIAKDVPVAPSTPSKRPTTAAQKEKRQDSQTVKRVHDLILKNSLANSAFVQWMRLGDYINDVAPQRRGGGGGGGKGRAANPTAAAARAAAADADDAAAPAPVWEGTPGNFDGIYTNILLPEMRNNKDVRIVEYWDNKIKREGEAATRSQKTFEIDKFNQVRRPSLMWSRDQDLAKVGQRNRAIADMFALIKAFPTHPKAPGWINELEQMLAPTPPAAPASTSTTPPTLIGPDGIVVPAGTPAAAAAPAAPTAAAPAAQ
jgi:hypothetical protein